VPSVAIPSFGTIGTIAHRLTEWLQSSPLSFLPDATCSLFITTELGFVYRAGPS
jgi:hypothetical protein